MAPGRGHAILPAFAEAEPAGAAVAQMHVRVRNVDVPVLLMANSLSRQSEVRVFPCTRCGACCRNLVKSPLLAQLDRGDGVCRHLDANTNLCRIYETRPKICRVSDMFSAFQDRLSWAEYVALNQQACRELQARPRRAAPIAPEPEEDPKCSCNT